MLNWVKKQGAAAWVACAAAVLALVAMIIYIANSTTGYLAGRGMNAIPVVFSILSILLLAAAVAVSGKVSRYVTDAILLIVTVLLSVSLAVFIAGRTDVAGDQWFIPGMATDAKGACLSGAIVGVVFYGISILAVLATGFMGSFNKEKA